MIFNSVWGEFLALLENMAAPVTARLIYGQATAVKVHLGREGIELAFIFGSLASNKERAASDVDLMVIGAVGLRTLSSWLAEISDQIGREINPHTLTVEEFRRRKIKGDHFLSNVLESPKLFILGNENDLAALG